MGDAATNREVATAERLRSAGLRATGPRVAILAALEADRTHPSAEELFERLRDRHPTLSRSTVYTTLDALLRAGLARRVNGDGARQRVDGTSGEHDHAICRLCGQIFDIDRVHLEIPAPPRRLPNGLLVEAVRLEYEVVCPACERAATGEQPKRPPDGRNMMTEG